MFLFYTTSSAVVATHVCQLMYESAHFCQLEFCVVVKRLSIIVRLIWRSYLMCTEEVSEFIQRKRKKCYKHAFLYKTNVIKRSPVKFERYKNLTSKTTWKRLQVSIVLLLASLYLVKNANIIS